MATIDKTKQFNTKLEPANITCVEGSYTKLDIPNKVHRENFFINVHGDDSAKKIYVSLDGQDDLKSFELNAGILMTDEFRYLSQDLYVKSKTGSGNINIAYWYTVDDGNPKR